MPQQAIAKQAQTN